MARVIDRRWSENWAYDISTNVLKGGEVRDIDVINQSIEIILGTLIGERLFNPFGSNFQLRLFDLMDEDFGGHLLEDAVGAIKRWEDRATVLENEVKLTIIEDQNSVILTIPYRVNGTDIKSKFQKKIIV